MTVNWKRQGFAYDKVDTHIAKVVDDDHTTWDLFVLRTSESSDSMWKYIVKRFEQGDGVKTHLTHTYTGNRFVEKQYAMQAAEKMMASHKGHSTFPA